MRIRLVGQPFDSSTNLYDFLTGIAKNYGSGQLRVGVAWAKRSGLIRVESALRDFREQGGKLTCVVGISEGGATKQGLQLVLDLSDECYVFHDPSRTFHPKCYLFSDGMHAEAFLGSNNLTAGGLFWNYELASHISLDLDIEEDNRLYNELDQWFSALVSESSICKRLDDSLLESLIQADEFQIQDEDHPVTLSKRDILHDKGTADDRNQRNPIFGNSSTKKRLDPYQSTKSTSAIKGPGVIDARSEKPSGDSITVLHRWFKKLSYSDAQQPKTQRSNITGNLKLGMARHAIDHKVYFRDEFFGDAQWESTPQSRGVQERATISFHVTIGDTSHGIQELTVDHASYRVAGQSNVPTWLHWNSYMGRYLRTHSHVGEFITIEVLSDGTYRLTIKPAPIGSFQA